MTKPKLNISNLVLKILENLIIIGFSSILIFFFRPFVPWLSHLTLIFAIGPTYYLFLFNGRRKKRLKLISMFLLFLSAAVAFFGVFIPLESACYYHLNSTADLNKPFFDICDDGTQEKISVCALDDPVRSFIAKILSKLFPEKYYLLNIKKYGDENYLTLPILSSFRSFYFSNQKDKEFPALNKSEMICIPIFTKQLTFNIEKMISQDPKGLQIHHINLSLNASINLDPLNITFPVGIENETPPWDGVKINDINSNNNFIYSALLDHSLEMLPLQESSISLKRILNLVKYSPSKNETARDLMLFNIFYNKCFNGTFGNMQFLGLNLSIYQNLLKNRYLKKESEGYDPVLNWINSIILASLETCGESYEKQINELKEYQNENLKRLIQKYNKSYSDFQELLKKKLGLYESIKIIKKYIKENAEQNIKDPIEVESKKMDDDKYIQQTISEIEKMDFQKRKLETYALLHSTLRIFPEINSKKEEDEDPLGINDEEAEYDFRLEKIKKISNRLSKTYKEKLEEMVEYLEVNRKYGKNIEKMFRLEPIPFNEEYIHMLGEFTNLFRNDFPLVVSYMWGNGRKLDEKQNSKENSTTGPKNRIYDLRYLDWVVWKSLLISNELQKKTGKDNQENENLKKEILEFEKMTQTEGAPEEFPRDFIPALIFQCFFGNRDAKQNVDQIFEIDIYKILKKYLYLKKYYPGTNPEKIKNLLN
jgi:hypothetical protein